MIKVTSTTEETGRPGNLVSGEMGLGSTITDRIYMQHFGLVSRPNAGDHVLLNERRTLAIAGGSEDRPSIEEGETCLYATEDISIILKPSGEIVIANASQEIKITSTGNIELGSGTLKKLVTDTFVGLFNSHTHNFPAPPASGAPTGPPLIPLVEASVCTTKVTGE